jgi:hypothetical protein
LPPNLSKHFVMRRRERNSAAFVALRYVPNANGRKPYAPNNTISRWARGCP